MKKEELRNIILEEAKKIKSLFEEKKQIEEALEELKSENPELEDEGLTVSKNLSAKKSIPKRLDDPHRLKEEEEIEEIMGVSQSVKRRADRIQDTEKEIGIREESVLRKFIRTSLLESYKIKI